MRALSRVLLFLYFLETGMLLIVVPWSLFWERNFFFDRLPGIQAPLLNHFVRGAVSGIGLVCVGAAAGEALALWRGRWSEPSGAGPLAPDRTMR